MTEVRFLRLAAALPIAMPLVAYGLLGLSSALPEALVSWLVVLGASLWIGGMPYTLLALLVLWLLRERPPSVYRVIGVLAPVIFAALFVVLQSAAWLYSGASGPINREFLILPAWCLILGYGYVAVAFLVLNVLRRLGAFKETKAAA